MSVHQWTCGPFARYRGRNGRLEPMISFVTMAVKISQGCMNWFGNEAMIISFILYRMYGVRAPYGAGFVRRLAQARNPLQCLNEKLQNCTPKMPNVTSETHNSTSIRLLLLLLLAPGWKTPWKSSCTDFCCCCCWLPDGKHHGKNHLPAGKHHASEGRRSPKIAP